MEGRHLHTYLHMNLQSHPLSTSLQEREPQFHEQYVLLDIHCTSGHTNRTTQKGTGS
jgi:hypothetical protein